MNTNIKSIEYSTYNKKNEKPNQSNLKLRRSERKTKGVPSERFEFAGKLFEISTSEAETFEEALSGSDSKKWKPAMDEEIHSLQENQTWTFVNLSKGSKVVGYK